MSSSLRPGTIIPLKDDPTMHVKLVVRQQTRLDGIWWALYVDTGKTVGVKIVDGKAEVIG
ncbi:MAG: hypothetical protein JXA14_26240 [Anaerolineae bacterium]|nr:hypothetical protein [Anaerolineae bacterium]